MRDPIRQRGGDNVVDLFSGKALIELRRQRIVRLAPEHDGLNILYSNKTTDPNRLYAMRIVCWALRADGEVVAMVPWLNRLTPCSALDDEDTGLWEGYYNPEKEDIFYQPPAHKVVELESAAEFFAEEAKPGSRVVVQEVPDTVGTHAMLLGDDDQTLVLTEVLSWRLFGDGSVEAMLIDENKVEATPILVGDPCLYPATSNERFRYFFQHNIANQIKAEDPAALAAIAMLFDP